LWSAPAAKQPSGDNSWHDSFQASVCKAFDGQCIAILKSKAPEGKATMIAPAPVTIALIP
jgi:hypothetical protein